MIKDTNLLDELNLAEQNTSNDFDFLQLINQLFKIEEEEEQVILQNIQFKNDNCNLSCDKWFIEQSIYSLDSIKKVALKFRLRFLESFHFKGEIPYEALLKVKEIQKKHNIQLKQFYILAPAKMFQLTDCNDDPMLFIPLESGKFHLVHQWGSDLKWYKKWFSFPFKNIQNLGVFLLSLSALLSLLIPSKWLSATESVAFISSGRVVFFLWLNLLFAAAISYCWFAFNLSFSTQNWRSKFFNF